MTNTIYIEIPNDMIWTNCDSDDYMVDATESQFLDELEKTLLKAFDFEVSFDISLMLCVNVHITSDSGSVDGETSALITSIIDEFEVDYIEIGDFNEIEPEAIMADENPEMLEAATRSIRPHKGGRTETVNARLTPDEKAALKTVMNASGLSLSDWIMQQIENTTTGDNTTMRKSKKTAIVDLVWYEGVVVFVMENPYGTKPRRLQYETSASNVKMEEPENVIIFGQTFELYWYPFAGHTGNSIKPCIHLEAEGNTTLHKFIQACDANMPPPLLEAKPDRWYTRPIEGDKDTAMRQSVIEELSRRFNCTADRVNIESVTDIWNTSNAKDYTVSVTLSDGTKSYHTARVLYRPGSIDLVMVTAVNQ